MVNVGRKSEKNQHKQNFKLKLQKEEETCMYDVLCTFWVVVVAL